MNRAPALLSCFGALVLAAACADLKTASPEGGNGASSTSSSGSSGTNGTSSSGGTDGTTTSSSGTGSSSGNTLGPGGKGPGPYGALPSGYCCTSDDECRNRHCADVGGAGGKMCLDGCRSPETCQGKGLPSGFTCDGSQANDGWCQPPGGFTCLAANTFVTGTKSTGSCCTATGNGTSGLECVGGHCDWFKRSQDPDYDPPFFCTNWCEVPADCGKGMVCELQINKCVPANEPFVCE